MQSNTTSENATRCKIVGCTGRGSFFQGKIYFRRGFCNGHYARIITRGINDFSLLREKRSAIVEDDIAKIPIGPNARSGYAIVDRNFSWLDKHRWRETSGYAATTIEKKTVLMHHLVIGRPSRGFQIDHINRIRTDNRTSNLRLVTPQENLTNKNDYKNSTTGHKGVYLNKRTNLWNVRIRVRGKLLFLGSYKDIDSAVLAFRDASEKRLLGTAYANR